MTKKKKPAKGKKATAQTALTWTPRAAFAKILVHTPGRREGRAICGADVPGIPAGDPRLFGSLLERSEVTASVIAELATAVEIARAAMPGHADACSGCQANLERMRDGDARKMSEWRGSRRNESTRESEAT